MTDASVIAKIESKAGVHNYREIAEAADKILIDRGDLAKSISLYKIPVVQKNLIRLCMSLGKEVFVATNFVDSMMDSTTPSICEVSDVYNALADGAAGVVLAAETAIGKYPVETVKQVRKIIEEL